MTRTCPGRRLLGVTAILLLAGCAGTMMEGGYLVHRLFSSGPAPVSVPGLDSFPVDLSDLGPESDEADVETLLGPPVFTTEMRQGDELLSVTWWYPLRDIGVLPSASDRRQTHVVFAARLEVFLDDRGMVDGWRFTHPVTGEPLEIDESLEAADRWMKAREDPPPRIELATVFRPGARRDDALTAMRWFDRGRAYASHMEETLVLLGGEPGREILTFFADRPSPLYIPPHFLRVSFWKVGSRPTSISFQGW